MSTAAETNTTRPDLVHDVLGDLRAKLRYNNLFSGQPFREIPVGCISSKTGNEHTVIAFHRYECALSVYVGHGEASYFVVEEPDYRIVGSVASNGTNSAKPGHMAEVLSVYQNVIAGNHLTYTGEGATKPTVILEDGQLVEGPIDELEPISEEERITRSELHSNPNLLGVIIYGGDKATFEQMIAQFALPQYFYTTEFHSAISAALKEIGKSSLRS